ncbi:MAG: hypothetical protein M1823_000735 [Watsoniomyces obsoletus]|nr:MAG: hypothetical protein M1823_000735 [Watsoniomyces obsoletus]
MDTYGDRDRFKALCDACRTGNTQQAMAMINQGANLHALDEYDYSPLVIASLCGHYEIVRLLLECGQWSSLCLYSALNDRIRNLLLIYGYSYYERHPLQPYAAHISSLFSRTHPQTADLTINSTVKAHKFWLAARSPYFRRELAAAPEVDSWTVSDDGCSPALDVAMQYIYLCEIGIEKGDSSGSGKSSQEFIAATSKISHQLEIKHLRQAIQEGRNRRIAQKRRTEEFVRGRKQMTEWFEESVLKHKVVTDRRKVNDICWPRSNAIFADVLLRADEEGEEEEEEDAKSEDETVERVCTIPIGPMGAASRSTSRKPSPVQSTLFPAHRAMLIRSDFFQAMFTSSFKEAQTTGSLQIISVDCTPDVLEVVLKFLYTEEVDFPPAMALDVLMVADELLIERLKAKAAIVISTLARIENPAEARKSAEQEPTNGHQDQDIDEKGCFNIYEIIRVGWLCRVRRLEEFGARHLAFHLEDFIDGKEFAELIEESAARIRNRQETDSIELLDDIRFYLSERFRLVFEDPGLRDLPEDEDHSGEHGEMVKEPSSRPSDSGESNGAAAEKEAMTSRVSPLTLETSDEMQAPAEEPEEDEFAAEAKKYRVLLRKIDQTLERLHLDA